MNVKQSNSYSAMLGKEQHDGCVTAALHLAS
jgi:hypothetical protein